MSKPWLSIGSTIIPMLSVVSLHLGTQQQLVANQFQTSLRSIIPALSLSLPWGDNANLAIAVGQHPPYFESIATPKTPSTEATLNPQDIASAQPGASSESIEFAAPVSNYFSVQNSPSWITQISQSGLENEGLRPILKHSLVTIGFRDDDHIFINRYANRQHLPLADTQWQYFDPTVISSLAERRRVATEISDAAEHDAQQSAAVDEETPRWQQEVAPGGGKYWTEDPNAAWW